ncbi:MAG: biliverdin-producing heme oxygenase [Campylobacterales bacterium]|nr:biliverdin-producing heme oxygenase [Campylobacterales bacterium]
MADKHDEMNRSTTPVDATFHHRLKTMTAPFHDALESTRLAQAMASGGVGRSDYARYLTQLYVVHSVIEPRVRQWAQWADYGIDIERRARLELLRLDLAALGVAEPSTPMQRVWDERWGFPEAVGVMYVLEGSTMGGRFLAQRLLSIVGNDGLPAMRYFSAYGDQTMRMWGEYTHFLNRYAQDATLAEHNRVLLAACALFLRLQEILSGTD